MPNVVKAKAKAKASSAKTAAIRAAAEAEKKAKTLLATWKLQENRLKRVEKSMAAHVKEWKWADGDLAKYKEAEAELNNYINENNLAPFVADFQAAIFSPQAMKSFKNQRKETFVNDLTLLVEGAVPAVKTMDQIVDQIENTAIARKCPDYTPEKRR